MPPADRAPEGGGVHWDAPPPRRPSAPLVLAAAAAVLLAGVLAGGSAALAWSRAADRRDAARIEAEAEAAGARLAQDYARAPAAARGRGWQVYGPDDLRAALLGGMADQVAALLGQPEAVAADAGRCVWHYPRAARGAADARVYFTAGRVDEVRVLGGPGAGPADGRPERGPEPREVDPGG